MRRILLGVMLASVCAANAAAQDIDLLRTKARELSAVVMHNVTIDTKAVDQDFIVELRVLQGGKADAQRTALMAFIHLVAEYGEREKELVEIAFDQTPMCVEVDNPFPPCSFTTAFLTTGSRRTTPLPAPTVAPSVVSHGHSEAINGFQYCALVNGAYVGNACTDANRLFAKRVATQKK